MHAAPLTTHAEEVDWLDALPAIQRLLLTTDGTMTTALAACHGEKVGVRLLGQEIVTLAGPDAALELGAGGKVLARRVLLFGQRSGTPFLYGCSRVALHRLDREVRAELLAGDAPIGLVLRSHRLETFRAPLDVGVRPGEGEIATHLGSGLLCFKTYAIIARGRPVMVVHEEFPATDLREAAPRCWSR
jgi:chorismate-pyruvate lyase